MQLTPRDLKRLYAAHPDLILVVLMAAKLTTIPFMVMESARSVEQQRLNIKRGVSWTMNSRHIVSKDGMCRAVDLVPIDDKGAAIWAWPVYYKLAPQIRAAGLRVGLTSKELEWGGTWKTPDGPHWQLSWSKYP
jgi:peptidoglycan L-alanyl-D-glutamate endopeptidase CwlK